MTQKNDIMPASQLFVELKRAGFLCNTLAQKLKMAIDEQGKYSLLLIIDTSDDFLVNGENYYGERFSLANQLPSHIFREVFEKLTFESDDDYFLHQFLERIDVDLIGRDLDNGRSVSIGKGQTFEARIVISPSVVEVMGIQVDLSK